MNTRTALQTTNHTILVDEIRSKWPEEGPDYVRLEVGDAPPRQVITEKQCADNETPESIASWFEAWGARAMSDANAEASMHFVGVVGAEGNTVSVYVDPPRNPRDAFAAMVGEHTAQLIRHNENKESMAFDLVRGVAKMMPAMQQGFTDTVSSLREENAGLRKRVTDLEADRDKYLRLYIEMQDHKAERDIAAARAQSGEKRKDQAADRLFGLLDQAITVGGAAVIGEIEKRTGPSFLDKFAALLDDDDDKAALADLMKKAQAKAAEAAAQQQTEERH